MLATGARGMYAMRVCALSGLDTGVEQVAQRAPAHRRPDRYNEEATNGAYAWPALHRMAGILQHAACKCKAGGGGDAVHHRLECKAQLQQVADLKERLPRHVGARKR